MGKLIQPARFRQGRAAAAFEAPADERAPNVELWPIAALLFVASVARVAHAVWRREPFGTEPTFALFFALALPWLVFHSRWKRR